MTPIYPLLGLLVQGERYGYELKRIVDQDYAPFWRIDFAQLYRSLAKMTRANWVKAQVTPSERGPDRKVYALTPRGRAEFDAWLDQPAHDREEFFVKLRLATALDAPVARMLDEQRGAFENERAARLESQHAARDGGDPGRLLIADAALRETEATLAALDLSTALLSNPRHAIHAAPRKPIAIVGSDDPLLAHLAQALHVSARPVGSFGGLLALSQQQADIAGVHLLDIDTGEYNVPFVRHVLPEENVVLVNLAVRENGLMLARGNPKKIRGLRDLTHRGLRFINRQRGAGTRLLLYSKLRAAGINPHTLAGWEWTVATHEAIAEAILLDAVDVGPGLRAVADAHGLDFIPLGEERYDLVIPRAEYDLPRLRPMREALVGKAFRQIAKSLSGYDITRAGQVMARLK